MPSWGLRNRTRLTITHLQRYTAEARVLDRLNLDTVLILCIPLIPCDKIVPFKFKRQFLTHLVSSINHRDRLLIKTSISSQATICLITGLIK